MQPLPRITKEFSEKAKKLLKTLTGDPAYFEEEGAMDDENEEEDDEDNVNEDENDDEEKKSKLNNENSIFREIHRLSYIVKVS